MPLVVPMRPRNYLPAVKTWHLTYQVRGGFSRGRTIKAPTAIEAVVHFYRTTWMRDAAEKVTHLTVEPVED